MNILANIAFKPDILGQTPAFIEITPDMLPFLERVLQNNHKNDPFARSVGYYAMTGRQGLWLYGDDHTGMMVAIHPNKQDTILFFPPFGKDPFGLVMTALDDTRLPKGAMQIARIGQDDAKLSSELQASGFPSPVEETILDWTYPIHVISVENVIKHKGGSYNNFRAHLNKAFRAGYKAQNLDVHKHSDAVIQIVSTWAKDGKKDEYSYDDLTTPTRHLLNLMWGGNLSLSGIVVFDSNNPIGFWIWDEGDIKNKTAMSLARVSIGSNGAAEFAGLKMAEILCDRGFEHICLGGSETESLDKFKRKFNPSQSIELKTINYRPS